MATYNTNFICTYHTEEIFLETDKISVEEKQFIRDAIYRQELLNVLGLEDFNEQFIYKKIHDLNVILFNCKEFNLCITKLASKFITTRFQKTNNDFGLMLLFSFDFFYQTHLCISEFLNSKKISKNKIEELIRLIEIND
jgi:hypothetical protein